MNIYLVKSSDSSNGSRVDFIESNDYNVISDFVLSELDYNEDFNRYNKKLNSFFNNEIDCIDIIDLTYHKYIVRCKGARNNMLQLDNIITVLKGE